MADPATAARAAKTCSRGHTFTGAGPCPQCWPSARRQKSGAKPGKRAAGAPRAASRPGYTNKES